MPEPASWHQPPHQRRPMRMAPAAPCADRVTESCRRPTPILLAGGAFTWSLEDSAKYQQRLRLPAYSLENTLAKM